MTMAHFAEIDENNIVTQVLVVPDEQEHRGQEFLADDLGLGGVWRQTSYNHKIRKQYAGIGFSYDEAADVFVAPQPFPSWTLDENHDWQAPKPKPEDDVMYFWNEETLDWEAVKYE
jgi:hypothetical protein